MISIRLEPTWHGDAVGDSLEAQAREVARRLAGRVAESAMARVPVVSGRLRDSIEVWPSGDGFDVVAGTVYAASIERGSVRNHGHAQPFLGPALADAFGAFDEVARGVGSDNPAGLGVRLAPGKSL